MNEIERAWRDYEAALKRLGRPKGGQGDENAYGAAFQRLVLLGQAPQLRGKYRRR